MQNIVNNGAFIDGANLHKAIEKDGWVLDYARFRIWLKEKHKVKHAYLFMGYIPKYADLYKKLEGEGYILIFKEVVNGFDGQAKGNCDADLVFEMTKGYFENTYDRAVLVSSDGDYARLVNFLYENDRLKIILSPSNYCSRLLRKMNPPITFLNQVKPILESK